MVAFDCAELRFKLSRFIVFFHRISSLRVFISGEQTKEIDEKVGFVPPTFCPVRDNEEREPAGADL
jgi:hypothetical protein